MLIRAVLIEGMLVLAGSGCVQANSGWGNAGDDGGAASDDGGATSEPSSTASDGGAASLLGEGGANCSADRTGCHCPTLGQAVACGHGGIQHCEQTGEVTTWGPCVCKPSTCAAVAADCGSVPDGCGGTLDCGSCVAPRTCGSVGKPNVCVCKPTTCAARGATCGSVSDGCGGTLDCGSCSAPQSCGGGGTLNVCGGCTTQCIPGAVVWCAGMWGYCYGGDQYDHQATETCQPDGTFGPCTEGGSAPGDCADGTAVGQGWSGTCTGAVCP